MTALFRQEEAALLGRFRDSPEMASNGPTVARGDTFGVTVIQRGVLLGIWGFDDTSYVFRRLSSWEPVAAARTIDEVLAVIFALIGRGRNNIEIAEALGLSENTIKHNITPVSSKLGVSSRVEAALLARERARDGRSKNQ